MRSGKVKLILKRIGRRIRRSRAIRPRVAWGGA